MSYALALVYSWLLEHPEYYCTWVSSHRQMRWLPLQMKIGSIEIDGYWRRRGGYGKLLAAIPLVCKLEVLSKPRLLGPPIEARRQRYDEEGLVPRKYRLYVFV